MCVCVCVCVCVKQVEINYKTLPHTYVEISKQMHAFGDRKVSSCLYHTLSISLSCVHSMGIINKNHYCAMVNPSNPTP